MSNSEHQPSTAAEMRVWLRDWVQSTTGLDVAEITDDRSMEEFGLSSRDVVVLSGELERLTGVSLDATVAYEYNTIAALADFVAAGGARARGGAAAGAGQDAGRSGGELAAEDRQIAIVGMAGSYPGAENVAEMWTMFEQGRSGVGELPEGRWTEYADDPEMSRRMAEAQLTGGYIEDIASFDAEFFGLSPLEAANMDPQQRIMLTLAWEALEDAGIPANTLRGTDTGVFVGSSNNDYGMLIGADPAEAHPYALTGNSTAVVANRISYAFDFRGPSVALDTACSASLVAIHQAVRSLRDGDSTVALAGGVNLLSSPFATVAFSELGVLSPTGCIHAFSEDADGIVRSDGAGVLVLKRLSDAVAAGDNVLGVIAGSAVNQDGRSNGLTAPNPEAQAAVLRAAYRDARIEPSEVDYVEAHGTGTILGDPIEAGALGQVLGAGRDIATPLLLGSAKTNFGHTEAAAGVAGVIKVVSAMREGVLPPTVNFAGPNPYIDFDRDHLEVVEDPREWPEYSGAPVAGVSGFGFGGTNAHVVVVGPEGAAPVAGAGDVAGGTAAAAQPVFDWAGVQDNPEADADSDDAAAGIPLPRLIPVSGLLPSRRRTAASDLAGWLEDKFSGAHLTALATTTGGRNHGRSRGIVLAHDVEEATAGLTRLANGKKGAGVAVADSPEREGAVWVYSGFGSQHRKMGKELYQLSPQFAARLHEIDEVVDRESGWSVVEMILDDAQNFGTETAQVGITAIQIALTDLMTGLGLRPAAVVGQSMGEIAAGYAVGGLTMEDAVTIACHRARLMGEGETLLPEDKQGAMAVIELGVDDLVEFQKEHPEFAAVEPAVYAAPGMTTVGGPAQSVADLVEHLDGQGKFARLLKVKGAGHTSMLDPILGELAAEISDIAPQAIHTPLYSTVDRGVTYNPGETVHDAEYFLRCTRYSVWFSDATGRLFDEGFRTFVEFSPNPVALMPMMNTAFAHEAGESSLMYLLKRKEPSVDTLLRTVGELYVRGGDVDFRTLYATDADRAGGARSGAAGAAAHRVSQDIPGVHWNLQRYWTAARPGGGAGRGIPGRRVSLPDGRTAFAAAVSDVPSVESVAEAAVHAVSPESSVTAFRGHGALPTAGEVTTLVARTLGGLTVQVYVVDESDGSSVLVGEAFAATLPLVQDGSTPDALGGASEAAGAVGTTAGAGSQDAGASTTSRNSLPTVDTDAARWDPNSGESAAERLRGIVSESMGYDVDDLPGELPLIDLGLDSLMGMRIKNRVEHDFDLPPLNVQALRDGSVDEVIALVEEMIGERHGDGGTASDGASESAAEKDAAGAASGAADTAAAVSDSAASDTDTNAAAKNASGVGVAPRDASERMVFGTWASFTGAAPGGVTSELPEIDSETATKIAERLNERCGTGETVITTEQVLAAETLEPLANLVREVFETTVEGNIRVLRARQEGSDSPAVFVFHPAGGSSVVYEPLTRRLPADVPVYGVERLEGSLDERADAYVADITALADGRPVVLGGWSFGGALAFEVAHRLEQAGEVTVGHLELLDLVRPTTPAPDTKAEMHARWDRYSAFAKKTYGIDMPVPHDMLEEQGEEAMIGMLTMFLQNTDASEHGLAAGVLEHQRASFVDTRILNTLDFERWSEVTAPVTLYKSEGMHEGAIELEPSFADIPADGGWDGVVDVDLVQLAGDHLAVPDEPSIGIVGAHITEHINQLR
ncbi:MAG TPA: acyltransferase domain-containing protein [Candidatus Corynebacterium faecigallinarum]|uniref:Acyltransferase domain-containing protein n=1 Tax=Candidatus Corynebacterium faecigallinarum TaxID=2838528 RepID=A0A9D2QFW1_9CORY|nr:acyltransferase domain-containing protein [Candidatus Corynebacterium faecigallinarum]